MKKEKHTFQPIGLGLITVDPELAKNFKKIKRLKEVTTSALRDAPGKIRKKPVFIELVDEKIEDYTNRRKSAVAQSEVLESGLFIRLAEEHHSGKGGYSETLDSIVHEIIECSMVVERELRNKSPRSNKEFNADEKVVVGRTDKKLRSLKR